MTTPAYLQGAAVLNNTFTKSSHYESMSTFSLRYKKNLSQLPALKGEPNCNLITLISCIYLEEFNSTRRPRSGLKVVRAFTNPQKIK